jgi:hypothetical protein
VDRCLLLSTEQLFAMEQGDVGKQMKQIAWELLQSRKAFESTRDGLSAVLAGCVNSYLVDPASSHMLVSKIKPCMSKYKQICTVKLRMAH